MNSPVVPPAGLPAALPLIGRVLPVAPMPLASELLPGAELLLKLERDATGQLLGRTPQGRQLKLAPETGEPGTSLQVKVTLGPGGVRMLQRVGAQDAPAPAAQAAAVEREVAESPAVQFDQAAAQRLKQSMTPAAQVAALAEPPVGGWGWLLPQWVRSTANPWEEEGGASASSTAVDTPLLSLCLPFQGHTVRVLLRWSRGLMLHISCEDEGVLFALHEKLPQLAEALLDTPLRIVRCLVSKQTPVLSHAPWPKTPIAMELAEAAQRIGAVLNPELQ